MNQTDQLKKLAGEKSTEFIKDGMVLGLGSGSTMYWTLKKLGELVQNGLAVKGIPSSKRTEGWAKEFGVPLTDFSETKRFDLAIDGADEIDPNLNLLKGGGGSLVREKIVNAAAERLIIVADESKIVTELGAFPLPVEVLPFGWEVTAERIAALGCVPHLRMKGEDAFVSDNGNYILDCQFEKIPDPASLHTKLKLLLGVVETGLFVGIAEMAIIGRVDGIEVLNRN